MMLNFAALRKQFFEGILPPLCHGCAMVLDNHNGLCPVCWADMPWIDEPVCERLGTPMHGAMRGQISAEALAEPPPWQRARAATRYDGIALKLIHDLKFRDNLHLIDFIAQAMFRAGRRLFDNKHCLVSIPIHKRRLWSRRFNQSDLLAKRLAQLSGLIYQPDYLIRTVATRPQISLSREQRRRNVSGVFAVPNHYYPLIEGRSIILIDDVLTSGATAKAATRTLLRAGAYEVDVLCFARVVAKEAILGLESA